MRSLKLSGLIRRNPDRPSLKQRAAALKATAAKVIRRPTSPADADPFESRPTPAGFVPYPFDAPAGWMNIRYALKAEGERLLLLALRELDRRVDAYRGSRFNEDEVRSHETRLRRELRIDALMALSGRMDPSDRPLPEPGSEAAIAAFHAACSETTRLMDSPINGYPELRQGDGSFWMKHSLGRALEDGTITVAEFARLHPLAAEREHRDDAALLASNIGVLHALAYANEYPQRQENEAFEPSLPAAGGAVSTDLQRAIEAHREAVQMAVLDPITDADRGEAHRARIRALADAVRAIPAQSNADLRLKVLYLWPGNIEGRTFSEDLSETFLSFHSDVMRLGSEPTSDADLIALGREFDALCQREADLHRMAGEAEERADNRIPARPDEGESAEVRERWRNEYDRINAEEGVAVADEVAERASDETTAVAERIATLPAATAEGLLIKVRAAAFYLGAPNTQFPGGRLMASLMVDAGAAGA